MADETTPAPAGQAADAAATTPVQTTAAVETVRDPEAVLKQNKELLAELKQLKEAAKKSDGFDFEKAKAAMEAQEKAEHDRLTKKGEWDKLKEQLDQRHAAELAKAKTETETLLTNLKREKLTNVLTEKGVLPDRAKYLVHELNAQIELVLEADGFRLKKLGGIGDAAEFDTMIENVKATSPFFFAATNASGSGASGSSTNGRAAAQTWTRQQWDTATTAERTAFSSNGGKITS